MKIKKPNEVIAMWAREGAKIANCGNMCSECAYKLNSLANLEPHNVDGAATAILSGIPFNCHKKGTFENAGKRCTGYLYAKAYADKMDKEEDE